jgi:hypothetical protein
MPEGPTVDPTATGQDAQLKVAGKEVAVTNVSWTRDVSTNDIQLSDSLNPTHVTTGLRYNGSFEYDGRDYELTNALLRRTSSGEAQKNEPIETTLTVTEKPGVNSSKSGEFTYTFTNVKVSSQSRDLPADGSASTTWDFVADDLSVSSSGSN